MEQNVNNPLLLPYKWSPRAWGGEAEPFAPMCFLSLSLFLPLMLGKHVPTHQRKCKEWQKVGSLVTDG
jgi:hypothetical protein